MDTIKVTTATGKVESKSLDTAKLLTETRKELGALMNEGDVFLGKTDEPVTKEQEKTTTLKDIVKDSAITIAKGQEEEPEEDSPGTTNPDNAAPLPNDGVVEPKVLPEATWAEDHVGLEDGLLKNGKPVPEDKVSRMKVGQVRNLLKENRIYLNREIGIAPAIVHNHKGDLVWSAEESVQCAQVVVQPTDENRRDFFSFQYTEQVSRLCRAATNGGASDVGVPGIFDVQGSYRTEKATRTDKRMVREHKSFNHLLPKARVVFKADKISLTEEFIDKIKKAVGKPQPATKLLDVLERYGQFFASDMMLGGRLNYWSDKKLEETYTEEQDHNSFQLAGKAKATIEGVPVEGGANWNYGLTEVEKKTVIQQTSRLEFVMRGGNTAVVSPDKWVPTLAKYLNWRVAGYNTRSLVPTLQYLKDDQLRAECIKILRDYFARYLQFQQTIKAGAMHAPPFGEDVGDVKRIVQIKVRHGMNVDGLQVTYELMNGKLKEMPWVAYGNYEKENTVGPLDFDEEISSIETATGSHDGSPELLRRLAFNTTKGKRFPASPNDYYGRGHKGETLTYTTIEAPRVCGLVGNSGRIVDSIGLRFRELAEGQHGPKSRTFLLEMEPYLFPSNLPDPIEMTLDGVLVAGKWRTKEELRYVSRDDKRNTLIVELGGHSNQDGNFFWGFLDPPLVGMGAIVVCLLRTGLKDRSWLKAHSTAEHRDFLIAFIHGETGEPHEALRRLTDGELVRWGSSLRGGG